MTTKHGDDTPWLQAILGMALAILAMGLLLWAIISLLQIGAG